MWVGDFELVGGPERLVVTDLDPFGRPYQRARLLILSSGEPIGMMTVDVSNAEIDVDAVAAEARDAFGPELAALSVAAGSGREPVTLSEISAGSPPAVSIVIGTRNRPEHVVACLGRLCKQDYPSVFEIIVVENGIVNDATEKAVRLHYGTDERVRYMAESRPGLSRARNIGLAAARYPIAAFLSDDILVEPNWLLSLARGFGRDEKVKAVTGFCPPAYLDTPEQLMFEGLMSWGTRQGFKPELYGATSSSDPLHPYRPGKFANGSNMAFDTAVFRSAGGFDEKLGPGTRCRGGEDLDAPIRLLIDGHKIAFEPAAVGWHADRYDDRPFHQHMYTYGLGLTAFLTKHLMESQTRSVMLRRIPHGLKSLATVSDATDDLLNDAFPIGRKNSLCHLWGRVAGPGTYVRARITSSD